MSEYIIIFFITSIFFLFIIYISHKLNLIDIPTIRKTHEINTPYTGGIALYAGLLLILKFYDFDQNLTNIIITSSGIVLVGFLDDKYSINIGSRLAIQLACAAILVFNGLKIYDLGNIYFFGNVSLGSFSIIFTLLCVILLMNTFNYLDGIDGLVGFFAIFTLVFLNILIFVNSGNYEVFLVLLLILFSVFLIFNMNSSQKFKIFLGDNGSLLTGYILGTLGIYYVYDQKLIQAEIFIWLIALPVYEFLSTNLSRLINNKNLFAPGKDHIHYFLSKKNFLSLIYLNILHILLISVGFLIKFIELEPFSIFLYIIFFFIYFLIREIILKNYKV